MNKFKYYFILLLAGISLVSCSKKDDDEDVVVVPVRDYAEQYKADNDSIIKYLKTNYIDNVTPDLDITIKKIPAGGTQVSIWDQKEYPLQTRPVYNRDVNYTVYYLSLRKGTGQAPCNTDKIFTAYRGSLLNGTVFDDSYGLARDFELYLYQALGAPIDGWGEIFPQFKTGTSKTSDQGVVTYENYGAGVMFLPSGLAYYANPPASGKIPAYAPLVFSFKLYDLQRLDHEYTTLSNGTTVTVGDGVPDYLEDLNGDGYLYDVRDKVRYPNPPANFADDTDGDGISDFLDLDDDGDGFSTRFEVTKPADAPNTGISKYYPWNPIGDDPATPNVDETELYGVPRRPTGALTDSSKPESINNPRKFIEDDYKANPRLRIYLDKTYPYQKN
ncbi:FKBP-type peptidyl-prolyl cis-trans isomerase [Flavobacterium plurextorum]|uniref:FKBP-type peptidyl-prolyl cis-trans isomerase n=1 Tax=Flavobacterium plurextorum TaxID=1114867 RepID=UPI003756861D